MKKTTTLIILFLFYFNSYSQDEWTMIHPSPTIDHLLDTHFISEEEGWVVGPRGLILYTDDGGDEWITQHSNPDESFSGIFFIDDNEGWVVGWDNVYHTENGGNTWEEQTTQYYIGDLEDVFFINPDTGWIVGSHKTILKTTNGGESWITIMNASSIQTYFTSVFFTDELNGYVVGCQIGSNDEGIVIVTRNGGITWEDTTPDNSEWLTKVIFTDSLNGWTCGHYEELRKTTDGGETWEYKGGILFTFFEDIHFFNDREGILLEPSSVRLTFDGGDTWDSIAIIDNAIWLKRFDFINSEFGIAVGGAGDIFKTTNGGSDWTRIGSSIKRKFWEIGFFDSFNGFAIDGYSYSSSELIRTNDGGYTWTFDTIIENGPFYKMYIKNNFCYLLNKSSQLMKTINMGADWELLDAPTVSNVYTDICFVNSNTGYMCSTEGALVKTIDGGYTWQDISLGNEYDFRNIFFIDEIKGWVIDSDSNTILHTINGGSEWYELTLSQNNDYAPLSIWFVNEELGYVTTYEGVLLQTTDGGITWVENFVFPQSIDSKIYFVSENEGWYKSFWDIYHTVDGGISWTNPQSFDIHLYEVFFIDNQQGWLCGDDGLVAIFDPTVDINEHTKTIKFISVFPNPTHDFIEVDLYNKSDNLVEIEVYNMHGQGVMHFPNLSGTKNYKFNVSELVNGAYIVHVTSETGKYLVKIIVQ